MRGLVHQFLKWFPTAVGGGTVAICAIWQKPREWVSGQFEWYWAHVTEPQIFFSSVALVALYVFLLIWTGRELITPPSEHIVKVQLIPIAMKGIDLHCYFTVENRGGAAIEIIEDRTTVPNSLAAINSPDAPRIIPPGGSLDIYPPTYNSIVEQKSVRFEILCRTVGDDRNVSFYYRFIIPQIGRFGAPMNPMEHGMNSEIVMTDVDKMLNKAFDVFNRVSDKDA